MYTNDHTISLIVKSLNGLANAEELDELKTWIQADPSNRKEYDVFIKIWHQTETITGNPTFDTMAAWSKMQQSITKIPLNKPAQAPAVITMYVKKFAVAASVLALVVLAWYFINRNESHNIIVSATQNQTLTLPDGTEIVLRKGGSITYQNPFAAAVRTVRLKGDAYFRVHRNEAVPFHIYTNNAEITVLGTTFFVRNTERRDEVMVTSGTVKVEKKGQNQEALLLSKGQKGTIEADQLVKTLLSDSNFLAWNSGIMNFKNTPVTAVLDDVANFYNLPVDITPAVAAEIKKIPITVRFANQPLEEVLDELRLITGLKISVADGKLTCMLSK